MGRNGFIDCSQCMFAPWRERGREGKAIDEWMGGVLTFSFSARDRRRQRSSDRLSLDRLSI